MKNILLILALVPVLATAQGDMHFRIIADYERNLLASVYNDSMEWVVFIDDLYESKDSVSFSQVSEGSTSLEYKTRELGVHHLLLRNKISGQDIAYVAMRIDYHTRSFRLRRGGVFTMWILEPNEEHAVYAPTRNNKIDSPLFTPGLLN
jgi:hypothetical protein